MNTVGDRETGTQERVLTFFQKTLGYTSLGNWQTRQGNSNKAAQARIKRREGGIIWHTQGSGKSLTMVWLAKSILETIPNGRVLIITDRTELDEQTFLRVSSSIFPNRLSSQGTD